MRRAAAAARFAGSPSGRTRRLVGAPLAGGRVPLLASTASMFDRRTLAEDLVDCRGGVLASRGQVVSLQAIAEVARRAPALPRRRLADTALAAEVAFPLEAPAYQPLLARGAGVAVQRALCSAPLPEVLVEELLAAGREAPALLRHGLVTAAVTVRMLLTAARETRAIPELAAAALVHDLGMRHLPRRLLQHREPLPLEQVERIAAHPILGAYRLAHVMGSHPAVAAAQGHHWRCGQGYPGLPRQPARSIEVIAVASAFAALTQPRPYRSGPYDARGAADVLVGEVATGHADANTVRLLVHALRGGAGDLRTVRFGATHRGDEPQENRHHAVGSPSRSLL